MADAVTIQFDTAKFKMRVRDCVEKYADLRKKAIMAVGLQFQKHAKDNAPVDKGILTADISVKIQNNARSSAALVYVPVNAPSSQYAIPMHEHYYNLGANSQAKQGKGKVVGRRYISRALEENKEEYVKIIRGVMEKNGNG